MITLPHSTGIEKSILSACIFGATDDVADILKPADFYHTDHQKMYEKFVEYSHDGKVDIPAVITDLPEKAKVVGKLMDYPVATSVEYSCSRIKNLSALREMIMACNEGINKCAAANGNATAVIDEVQSEIISIAIGASTNQCQSIEDILQDCIEHWEAVKQRGGGVSGITTGFNEMDRITAGLQSEDFIIIAARPGMGKSALALNLADNQASKNLPVGFFSLEMSKLQLTNRIVSRKAKINSKRFRSCDFNKSEWSRVTDASAIISTYPLFIDDTPALHYMEIRRRARKMKKDHDIKAVYIDYLQLAKGDRDGGREQEIGSISQGFKAMAKDLKIPVIALSQLNRKVEERTKKKPVLSDLRESGSLEQDTDVVTFIYRDDYYNDDENNPNKGVANIIFAKQRQGEVGEIDLVWMPDFVSFGDKEVYRK